MKNDYTEKDDFYFSHVRYDVIEEIDKFFKKEDLKGKRCLEIGCGSAITAKAIKEKYSTGEFIGVEYVSDAAKHANKNIDHCYSGRVEDIFEKELSDQKFDFIFYMDVLEHLYDPWGVFNNSLDLLNDGGYIVASIPNVAYYEVICRIIFDKFEYNPGGGIMDSTHIRWFTKHTILDMFKNTKVISCRPKTVTFNRWYIKPIFAVLKPLFRKFFAIQYLVVAQKNA